MPFNFKQNVCGSYIHKPETTVLTKTLAEILKMNQRAKERDVLGITLEDKVIELNPEKNKIAR